MKKLITLIFLFLLYDSSTGIIYYTIPDWKYDLFKHSTNIELSEYHIDELNSNLELCNDLLKYGKYTVVNTSGVGKYIINTGNLYETENWSEFIDN